MTAVETYLESKDINYRLDGHNAILECPFCKQDEGQFGINIDNWFYNCFRGKCAAKGNERSFKKKFGDSVEQKSNLEDDDDKVVTSQASHKETKAEAVPDVEKAHQALLEDDELLNYLNDERGFSLETVKKAKLGKGLRKFDKKDPTKISTAIMYPYFEEGKCVGVKYRTQPPEKKDFRYTAGREVGLYRKDVIKDDMESLILCEGESDTLALLEVGIENAVGVPGCEGKKVTWDAVLDLPQKLYLVFDNDEAGQKGALAFATRFGIDRFYNVVIPQHDLPEPVDDSPVIKDINEFFMAGHTVEEFNELLANARPFDIEGVTTMDAAFDELIKHLESGGTLEPAYKFKWDSVTQRAKGIDKGDLVVILAPAKCGKTTFLLNQTEFMLSTYDMSIHFDCMEMSATQLIKKWAAMMLVKEEDILTQKDIAEAKQIARDRNHQFVFTRSSPNSLDEYLDGLRKTKRRYDTKFTIIDNFQILVDLTIGRGNINNRPSYMSQVSKRLKAVATELGAIGLISQPKALQEGKMVGAHDSEGSSALTKDADLFITMNRNPEVTMTLAQRQAVGNLETNQSHSDNVYVDIALSRRSAGGSCTLKIDGARSIIREYSDEENNANTKKVLAGGIEISQEAVDI